MRTRFHGYYCPTDLEFEALWKECVFTFDASALLNIYAYSKPTRLDFVSSLEKLVPRIWLPHQFADENA